MFYARAEVATSAPDRYVEQLVSHLGHQASSEWRSDGTAVIDVHDGRCTLAAGSRAELRVKWRADGPADPA